jgi:uncharacterized protein YfaQ (DUF2300 family)
MKVAKKKPQTVRMLEGLLQVKELSMEVGSLGSMRLGAGALPDGTRFEVSASLGSKSVILERTGHPTRVVELQDLVATMFAATPPEV